MMFCALIRRNAVFSRLVQSQAVLLTYSNPGSDIHVPRQFKGCWREESAVMLQIIFHQPLGRPYIYILISQAIN